MNQSPHASNVSRVRRSANGVDELASVLKMHSLWITTTHQCARAEQESVRANTRLVISDMNVASSPVVPNIHEILDVTTEVSREYLNTSMQYEASVSGPSSPERSVTPTGVHIDSNDTTVTPEHGATSLRQGSNYDENSAGEAFGGIAAMNGRTAQFRPPSSSTYRPATMLVTHSGPSPASTESQRSFLISSLTGDLDRSMNGDEDVTQAYERRAAAGLLSLGHELAADIPYMVLTDNLIDAEPIQTFDGDTNFDYSPEVMTDDGIFLPGSTYQDLHKTLRNHVFHTARSKPPSCQGSPERISLTQEHVSGIELPSESVGPEQADLVVHSEGSHTLPELAAQEEYILWKNWIEEISAWVSTVGNGP